MANVQLLDYGATYLQPGAAVRWLFDAGTDPNMWCWVTAMPKYKNSTVQVLDQMAGMDANGMVVLSYTVKNTGANATESWEHILRVYP